MAGTPLKILNTSDLQEMTDADIDNYIVPAILFEFASDQTTSLRGNLNLANGTGGGKGDFSDTRRDDAAGTHPTDSASSTISQFTLSQDSSTEDVSSGITRPARYISSGQKLQEITSDELKDKILLRVANHYENTLYCLGAYHLGTAAPDSDTWTDIGVSANDTFQNSGGGVTTTTYKLRRKTGPATSNTSPIPMKIRADGTGLNQMTLAEIKSMAAEWRNFLLTSQSTNGDKTIGEYVAQASAPGTGTWVSAGTYTNSIADVTNVQYSGTYAGTYTLGYTQAFSGSYTSHYSGSYTSHYSGSYTSSYGGSYSLAYSSTYSRAYQSTYSNSYSGTYQRFFGSSLQGSYSGSFSTSYTGSYTSTYTGSYTSTYSGTYSAAYSQQYSLAYSQQYSLAYSAQYSLTYTGNFGGSYTAQYTGATVSGSSYTNTVTTLFKRVG